MTHALKLCSVLLNRPTHTPCFAPYPFILYPFPTLPPPVAPTTPGPIFPAIAGNGESDSSNRDGNVRGEEVDTDAADGMFKVRSRVAYAGALGLAIALGSMLI